MTSSSDVKLGDIGERRLVAEVLAPRYREGNLSFGDDVADFGMVAGGVLVATTDPAPMPAAWEIFEQDMFDWGWLLGALNLSDLAAAGAEPIGMLTSFTLPNDTLMRDFLRLLDGVDAVCHQVGTQVRGGNLKESTHAVCDGTALGIVEGHPLSRLGAEPGDALYAFGDVGLFWSALLAKRNRTVAALESEAIRLALTRPRPLISVGRDLRTSGIAKACMDASDGLFSAIMGLTVDQGLGFRLDADSLELSPSALSFSSGASVDHLRLALGFGNLEIVCAADIRNESRISQLARRNGVHVTRLGMVKEGDTLRAIVKGVEGVLSNFDNERFSSTSQFTAGLDGYADHLLNRPLLLSD